MSSDQLAAPTKSGLWQTSLRGVLMYDRVALVDLTAVPTSITSSVHVGIVMSVARG